ncbi:uncharacterized protein KY384_003670 [Bacidia gigantensis]|uniref:uncharacterized protein n=1 Tax=Bacidia gigantensis TaxID=2732470 RepID=UPI001D03EF73|nr:uncharacterized protein KY384_003670 [Bacidia gigantensis]KAG8532034.1 hypothetical protein KY384_003670 [Bacidia gigantensis]
MDMKASWNPALRPDSEHIVQDLAPNNTSRIEQERNATLSGFSEPSRNPPQDLCGEKVSKLGVEERDLPKAEALSLENLAGTVVQNGNRFGEVFEASVGSRRASKTSREMDRAFGSESREAKVPLTNGSTRTDYFPDIPQSSQLATVIPDSLPRSQAEKILEEEELVSALQEPAPVMATTKESLDDREPSFGDDGRTMAGVSSVGLEDKLSPAHVLSLKSEQIRFEEGLPLVAQTYQYHTPSVSQSDDVAGERDPVEEDDSFFDRSDNSLIPKLSTQVPSLNRKSTDQVLSSMNLASHDADHAAAEPEVRLMLSTSSIGEANPAMFDVVESQIQSEQQREDTELKLQDEDLSELWKAALADEGLLDESDQTVDPSSFFVDDGEDFLEDDVIVNDYAKQSLPSTSSSYPQLIHHPAKSIQKHTNPYAPAASSSQHRPALSSYYTNQPDDSSSSTHPSRLLSTFQQERQILATNPSPARPQLPEPAQSFVDKSKGGYKSPYDLPMDVTRSRRRAPLPTVPQSPGFPPPDRQPPPPRSSSMTSGTMPLHSTYHHDLNPSSGRSPPAIEQSAASVLAAKPSLGSFFEDLPDTKARPPNTMGRASIPTAVSMPTSQTQEIRLAPFAGQQQRSSYNASSHAASYELLPPEKLNLFSDTSPPHQPKPAIPIMNSKYSPIPSHTSSVPPPATRYASSPAPAPRPPSTQALPHQPRMSSPLTQSDLLGLEGGHQQRLASDSAPYPALRSHTNPKPADLAQYRSPTRPEQSQNEGGNAQSQAGTVSQSQVQARVNDSSPFPLQPVPPSSSTSASSHPIYTPGADQPSPNSPQEDPHDQGDISRGPPKRSQTQSPGARRPVVASAGSRAPYHRPASVSNYGLQSSFQDISRKVFSHDRPAQVSSSAINYIIPTDGRELDQLERWKGCPIFSFGFGGRMVKMFPRQIPRYATGQKLPLIKCSPGEVMIDQGTTFSLPESVKAFPGPLKAKAKKKEVIDWLHRKLRDMETNAFPPRIGEMTLLDPTNNREERILLWKIMEIFVEYDGLIEGNALAEKAVRTLLSPELNDGDATSLPQNNFTAPPTGITRQSNITNVHNSPEPDALEGIRKQLLRGEREQAAWHAVDHRMWAHAMLIASTLDKTITKQITQEFVRQEVKTFGENTESLSVLYQVFAGNWEESVDELVPPSARAGLQLVSKKDNAGPTRNALDGLDRWRETLTLILGNRTADDGKALLSLGQLLAGYGRTEAAHICYIFASTPGLFGGPDDPQVNVHLLGVDHLRRPFDYGRDFDSILLTEVYDFARTVLSGTSVSTLSPHLQPYKLYHAMVLAEYGLKPEAQQYCEAIFNTLKSTTRPSPYYHALLAGSLETLQDRLRQAPRDASGSWISKPSMDKVSGSIWAKFNSYVAGDEDDAASSKSGKTHDPASGPFAGVSGESPSPSRATSSSDLYNSYQAGVVSAPTAPAANARYTPGSVYTPRSSLEQSRLPFPDPPKHPNNETFHATLAPPQYSSRPTSSSNLSQDPYTYSAQPSPLTVQSQSYLPTPPLPSDHNVSESLSPAPQYQYQSYTPSPPNPDSPQEHAQTLPQAAVSKIADPYSAHQHSTNSSYGRSQLSREAPSPTRVSNLPQQAPSTYQPTMASYEANSSAYQPQSSYEPPSYFPDVPPTEVSPRREISSEIGADLDEDDDFEARAKVSRQKERDRKDREADEAFRKAAEADAQRNNAPRLNSKKSGWFGGSWFGGSKEESNDSGNLNAPIKVKLGEESSFYFDKELGKWVNKKGGNTETISAATPPPPKGPPSRSVSAAGVPPLRSTPIPPVPPIPKNLGSDMYSPRAVSGPAPSLAPGPSPLARTVSPATQTDDETASGPPSAPPSRPATSQGGANNIDDLLGLPQARKGGTMKKGRKGRGYVDVMAK